MYNYDDVIEYKDGTNDPHFNNAALWAISNNAKLTELIEKRKLPKRYFKIVKNPEPTPPSEDELKAKVRAVRDSYLLATDYTQLPDAPFTPEQKAQYAEYREYLRNYTETEEWWLNNPMDFNSWRKKQ